MNVQLLDLPDQYSLNKDIQKIQMNYKTHYDLKYKDYIRDDGKFDNLKFQNDFEKKQESDFREKNENEIKQLEAMNEYVSTIKRLDQMTIADLIIGIGRVYLELLYAIITSMYKLSFMPLYDFISTSPNLMFIGINIFIILFVSQLVN